MDKRGYVLLAIGLGCLVIAGLQIWHGRAFIGYGWKAIRPWVPRKQSPFLFWGHVGPIGALGCFAVYLGVKLLLG